ncbi:MAG: peptidylprolyl isomerase [Myxococcales bacterium]|nr:peptidylprolyl isomerase [Myxococcales bacterium]
MAEQVENGKVVLMHYALKTDDKVVESTFGGSPMAYLHGHGNLVPGLETALSGREVGARLEIRVEPAQGFGEKQGKGAMPVPRKEFPKKMKLQVGMPIEIKDSAGTPVKVWVTKVQGSQVWIDLDHPLAGKELTFDVEILGIRDPMPSELEHGHAHGPDGQHHH